MPSHRGTFGHRVRAAQTVAVLVLAGSVACGTDSPRPVAPTTASATEPASATGPAPAPPGPTRCEISSTAPTAATSLGAIRVEVPTEEVMAGVTLVRARLDGATWTTTKIGGPRAYGTSSVAPGTYKIMIENERGEQVWCDGVEIAAGAVTTVHVRQFRR